MPVGWEYGLDGGAMPEWPFTCHRSIEQRADLWLFRQIFVRWHGEDALTSTLAGPHGFGHIIP